MPKVSVIIPCFNQGEFLDTAVDSVLGQTFKDIEIFIVNDGSTDHATIKHLENYHKQKTNVIHTSNQGLAAARNNGIHRACGEYILPLDADDYIEPEYIQKAVEVLDSSPQTGIVYSRAQLFGAVNTEWNLPPYSLREMLQDNLIFCSAMFRRKDWEDVGGYDSGMVYGWEDYEFWISLLERGREVFQIPEILFCYRVASDSMVRSKEKWQKIAMFKRIQERHTDFYNANREILIEALLESREQYFTSRMYADCGGGVSDKLSVSRKVEKGTSEIHFQMDEFSGVLALRFDPVDVPAVVEVVGFHLLYEDGSSTSITNFHDNSFLSEDNIKYFINNDPQYHPAIPQQQLQGLTSVIVKLKFIALATEALSLALDAQQRKIENLERGEGRDSSAGVFSALTCALSRRPEESISAYVKRQLGLKTQEQ